MFGLDSARGASIRQGPSRIHIVALQDEAPIERWPDRVGGVGVARDGEREELRDRVGGDGSRDGEGAAGSMDSVPVMDRRLLYLVPDNEADVLLGRRPGPSCVLRVGSSQDSHQPVGTGPEGVDQLIRLHGGGTTFLVGRLAEALVGDGGPHPLDIGHMPNEVGNRPAWAILNVGAQVAISGCSEAGAVLGDGVDKIKRWNVHPPDASQEGRVWPCLGVRVSLSGPRAPPSPTCRSHGPLLPSSLGP